MPGVRPAEGGRVVGRFDRGRRGRGAVLRVQSEHQRRGAPAQDGRGRGAGRAGRMGGTGPGHGAGGGEGVRAGRRGRLRPVGRPRGRRGRGQPPVFRGRVEQAHRRRAVQRHPVVGQPDRADGGRVRARARQTPVPAGVRSAVQPVLQRVQNQMARRQRAARPGGARPRRLLLRHRRLVARVELDRRHQR